MMASPFLAMLVESALATGEITVAEAAALQAGIVVRDLTSERRRKGSNILDAILTALNY